MCLLCGCSAKDDKVLLQSRIKYNVSTGDTVEIFMQSYEGYSIEMANEDSLIIKGKDDVANIEFAVTDDVLNYTQQTVPKVLAGYPAFRLDLKKKNITALMLDESTTMLVTALAEDSVVEQAMNCCDIFIY